MAQHTETVRRDRQPVKVRRKGRLLTDEDLAARNYVEAARFADDWSVYVDQTTVNAPWLRVYIRVWKQPKKGHVKVSFATAWNGERFSRSEAIDALEKHYPQINEEAKRILREMHSSN